MTDQTPGLALGPALRALRRHADLSQRQLAERAGVPAATVARIESATAADPRFRTVERLVRAAGQHLTIVDRPPDTPHEELVDEAGRRYPAHLDVRPVSRNHPMWTFQLDRNQRDWRRATTVAAEQVEIVRVAEWHWVGRTAGDEDIAWLRGALWDGELVHVTVHVTDGWRGFGIGRRLVATLRAAMDGAGVRRARALVQGAQAAKFFQDLGFTWDWVRPIGLTLDLEDAEQPRPR